jgi:hypothetical protein
MKATWVDNSPKIVVYTVTCEELGSAIVWDNLDDAAQEKIDLEDEGYTVELEIGEMTQWEYDNLEEFEGY